MQRKKLIYILNSYSASEASHFHHVLNLLAELGARGIEIALVIEKADLIPHLSNEAITVIALKNRRGLIRYLELFHVIRRLIRKGYERTYIRIAAPAALVATVAHRLYGGETFFWQSGTTIEYDRAQPPSLEKIEWYLTSNIPNVLARRFVHYFVTGPESMVDYYARIGGVAREKIRLLYNDIDLRRFSPPSDRQERKVAFLAQHDFAPDTLILLLVHRLSPVRRTQLYFPNCLAHLAELGLLERVVVVVAGGGPELPAIKAEAEANGTTRRCIFLGSVPNRDIEKLYGLADIFLHPSYNEGFPRVILEAMAAGLPIASTDAGGTRELLGERQASCIVSRDDPSGFADRLVILVRHTELREALHIENLKKVKQFSTPNIAAMYDEVIFGQPAQIF